ncbi:hypothetical protein CGMCC3_g6317 [Colletotrichum fructicola]|nr:uncharacterized protein CGMCC3_g6317 [Colletotrichum fructicola]KAE9577623.1 hypothetical protein CGMCC3_g6317 [Colletotrichum fructicola]
MTEEGLGFAPTSPPFLRVSPTFSSTTDILNRYTRRTRM